ncbi:MAG: nucleotidyl transferase AbiEii/AbiGii toxin family protein [Ignavibacteriae bacterium]|nr:nucleotidyl transferase AbiEii/AbiGii toxin family protein [Ignavibacteriota bacterium]
MSGGTALAEFYLHHRLSEDLDFFSTTEFEPTIIIPISQQLKTQVDARAVQLEQRFNRNILYLETPDETLKLEFSWYIGALIEQGQMYRQLRIDSARDIAVNKLFTIYQRPRARDYVDLYFLMNEYQYDLHELMKLARLKFDWHIDPIQLGGRFVEPNLEDWPIMIRPLAPVALTEWLKETARTLEKDVLTD